MAHRLAPAALLLLALSAGAPAHPSPAPLVAITVTAMSPAPGSVVTTDVSQVTITLSGSADALTVSTSTVILTGAGADNTFDTADDFTITPSSTSLSGGNQIVLTLSSALGNGLYRVKLIGTVTEPTGCVHRYTFDEGSGSTTADSAGAANGTISGPTWTTGRLLNGLHFDGLDNRVSLGLADLPSPWSVSLWVRREDSSAADARITDSNSAAATYSLRLEQFEHTDKVGITTYGVSQGDKAFGHIVPVNTWWHLVFTSDGASVKLYANTLFSDQINTSNFSCPLYSIGSSGFNSMKGDLDEVRVYNKVLSASEIDALHKLGKAVRSSAGNVLDGEFSGSFPSGNGTDGGDYVATFQVSIPIAGTPSGLTAGTLSNSSVQLNWTDNASNETGFRIERSLDGTNFLEITTVGANVQTYTDTELGPGSTYWYRVRAFNAAGNTAYSNTASTTTSGAASTIRILAMTPAPSTVLSAPPSEILVTFNVAPEPDTISSATVRLVRAGTDGALNTSDDVVITPTSLTMATATQLKLDLSGLTLPNDIYGLTISGTVVPVAGLVNHWKLDEGAGTTVADATGSGLNGTVSGPTWTTGRLGSGLQFAGGTNTVLIAGSNLSGSWTAAMWVHRTDSPNQDSRLMDSNASAPVGSLRLEQFNNTNAVGVTKYGAWDKSFGVSAAVGTWVHLTFVHNGTDLRLYIDGVLKGTILDTVACPRYHLGSNGGNSLVGVLDDVRVYSRAVTATEAGALGTLGGAIRDAGSIVLDGEYSGSFPTGNGTEGGTFSVSFSINITAPAPPTNLTASGISSTQIQLNWTDASTGEEGFRVERSLDNLNWIEVASLASNSTSFIDAGLTPLTLYFYRVRAYLYGMYSAYSNVAQAGTSAVPASNNPGGGGGGGGGGCGLIGLEAAVLAAWGLRRRRA